MKNYILFLVLFISLSSCVQHRELVNFNEADLPIDQPAAIGNAINLAVQPEDLLRITVSSLNPLAAEPFNDSNDQMRQGGGQGQNGQMELFMGYFVDQDGNIDFPVLGAIPVAGKTLEAIELDMLERLRGYLKDPVVNIRYLNFKITILGEVNGPGTINLSNKRVTILEALGMAGDLSSYANRKNILIIREEAGQRTYSRINLQSNEIFTSPYFYLKQNDVIYVEPIKAKIATVADPAARIIQYASAALSLTSIIIALTVTRDR